MRVRKYFLLFICIISCCITSAQVVIHFNAVADGAMVNKLAKVSLNNRYNGEVSAQLTITITEAKAGIVLKVRTPAFILSKGANVIPATIFQKSQFVYANNSFGLQIGQTRMFPDGEYEYCFEVNLLPFKQFTPPVDFFESCFNHTVSRMVPLELINPYEKEISCNKRPNFLWQPALPYVPGTQYTLVLVELLPGQLKAEAIAYSKPVILQHKIVGSSLNFPATAPMLQEGKSYAWQVLATNGKLITTRSEIWEYRVKCTEENRLSEKDSYRELKDNRDDGVYYAHTWLRFAFYNPYGVSDLDYSIADLTKKEVQLKRLPKLNMQAGFNKYELDLESLTGLEKGHQYLLTVNMSQGKKLYLTFEYKGKNDEQ